MRFYQWNWFCKFSRWKVEGLMFTVSKYHVIYSPNGVPYIWDKMFTKCLYLRFFEFEFEDWHSRYFYLKNTLKNNDKKSQRWATGRSYLSCTRGVKDVTRASVQCEYSRRSVCSRLRPHLYAANAEINNSSFIHSFTQLHSSLTFFFSVSFISQSIKTMFSVLTSSYSDLLCDSGNYFPLASSYLKLWCMIDTAVWLYYSCF